MGVHTTHSMPSTRSNRYAQSSCCVQAGRGLFLAALDHIRNAPAAGASASRIGLLLNLADATAEPSLLSKLLLATSQLTSRRSKIPGVLCYPFSPMPSMQAVTVRNCSCSWFGISLFVNALPAHVDAMAAPSLLSKLLLAISQLISRRSKIADMLCFSFHQHKLESNCCGDAYSVLGCSRLLAAVSVC